jgi:hypothetical protein
VEHRNKHLTVHLYLKGLLEMCFDMVNIQSNMGKKYFLAQQKHVYEYITQLASQKQILICNKLTYNPTRNRKL